METTHYSINNHNDESHSNFCVPDQTTGTSLKQLRQAKRANGQQLYKKLVTQSLPQTDRNEATRIQTPGFDWYGLSVRVWVYEWVSWWDQQQNKMLWYEYVDLTD